MVDGRSTLTEGLAELRRALAAFLPDATGPGSAVAAGPAYAGTPGPAGWLLSEAVAQSSSGRAGSLGPSGGGPGRPLVGEQRSGSDDLDPGEEPEGEATSSEEDPRLAARLITMVERAREGDPEAFGVLFDHYHPQIYRFVYYRTGSVQLAEDLSSEAFVRALRNIGRFTWQGKDFGAWLTTIARNLVTDHYKSARSRLESPTEDSYVLDSKAEGPEGAVLASLTNELLLEAVRTLPEEQQTCIAMRFLQGYSIAEVAVTLGRSEGAVKQLQLRAVRNLAKRVPRELR